MYEGSSITFIPPNILKQLFLFSLRKMSSIVVLLKIGKIIAVKENWIKKPVLNTNSCIFYSPDLRDHPDFKLKKSYFFNEQQIGVYEGYVLKKFGKCAIFFNIFSIVVQYLIYFYFVLIGKMNEAQAYITHRENRQLRPRNYFSSNTQNYKEWNSKGVVEMIDLSHGSDEDEESSPVKVSI